MGAGMANISVRGIDDAALRSLKRIAKQRGVSVNRLAVEMLSGKPANVAAKRPVTHDDLDTLAGTWTTRDAREFAKAVASFEQIDETSWR